MILPLSITINLSTNFMKLSSWKILIIIMFFLIEFKYSKTFFSDSLSKLLVASSNNKISGLLSIALAKPTFYFWPPDKFSPFSRRNSPSPFPSDVSSNKPNSIQILLISSSTIIEFPKVKLSLSVPSNT